MHGLRTKRAEKEREREREREREERWTRNRKKRTMKRTKKNRDEERMSAPYSKHRDYFVRLYTLNHPVGFLSRADGSRSRIKACGLLRASIMTQSAIHLAPTLFLPSNHQERDRLLSLFSSSLPSTAFLSLSLSLSLSLCSVYRYYTSVRCETQRGQILW